MKNTNVKSIKIKKKTLSTLIPRWREVAELLTEGVSTLDIANIKEIDTFSRCVVGEAYYNCAGYRMKAYESPSCSTCRSLGVDFSNIMRDIRHQEYTGGDEAKAYLAETFKKNQEKFLTHWNKNHVGVKSIFIKNIHDDVREIAVSAVDTSTKKAAAASGTKKTAAKKQ